MYTVCLAVATMASVSSTHSVQAVSNAGGKVTRPYHTFIETLKQQSFCDSFFALSQERYQAFPS